MVQQLVYVSPVYMFYSTAKLAALLLMPNLICITTPTRFWRQHHRTSTQACKLTMLKS